MTEKLIEHHIKYREIHGVDETVWMTKSEHTLLHNRLRREGKCNIPADELHKIADRAHDRTDKVRKKRKIAQSEYRKRHFERLYFTERMCKHVQFLEDIRYNNKTGVVQYYARFRGTDNHKLQYKDI